MLNVGKRQGREAAAGRGDGAKGYPGGPKSVESCAKNEVGDQRSAWGWRERWWEWRGRMETVLNGGQIKSIGGIPKCFCPEEFGVSED